MLLRDRKAIVAPLLVGAGYLAAAMVALDAALGRLLPVARAFPPLAPPGSLLGILLVVNAAALVWRLGLRIAFTWADHGWREGLRAAPRVVVANWINANAAVAALRRYFRIRRGRETPRWDKTAHRFPALLGG